MWQYIPYYPSLNKVLKNGIHGSSYKRTEADDRRNLIPCLKRFFSNPYISKLTVANDWATIIDCWCTDWKKHHGEPEEKFDGNLPGWPVTYLTDFLYYSGIEFWKHLPENYDDKEFQGWFDRPNEKTGSRDLLVWEN